MQIFNSQQLALNTKHNNKKFVSPP